ncbi:MAG: 4-(cytidine 5'-diphospho)-2-C-methyl-D-erythritol kinase [Oscillatoriales cyanobacterium RM1_1_9]|nr:4-(cytidine 5'-diphospho)-2-C-methyl-D-erythritol kinase [Oscillatoriales cyanobacterium SM2_3_0]NJO45172.1 4-(cytidine 5'-diphospho)-2-C-methyl-D-erythritol kinase [Oscillatoriales cyanobacterium RM2_1_1]NJO71743.1 4-(cytidine 5'-diphospho)-2-C-methyl-D-erythritol kinase [Oscillatoriales cyanobacterium RM1_1_9]
MRSYSLVAPAKINLYLEIIGDRPDGYHELVMVLQAISLADKIEISSIEIDAISIKCDHPGVPDNQNNLAYRAAALMAEQFPHAIARYGGVEIKIQKTIPIAAGLAGGSSNAAAVLVGLDLLWELGLTQGELQELGGQIGSDVPFCLEGGTALATGRGEVLSPLANLDQLYLVLAKYHNLQISTPWAYKTYRQQFSHTYVSATQDLQSRRDRVHSGPIVAAVMHQDGAEIGRLLHNDLEKVALPEYPQIQQLRQMIGTQPGVLGAMMSGSGPTVFGLVQSQAEATQVMKTVRGQIPDPELGLWTAKFISQGISLV